MKKIIVLLISLLIGMTACTRNNDDDDMMVAVSTPETYSFLRDGNSTVSFSGQTTRIQMANEIINRMKDFSATETTLHNMFSNKNNSFSNEALNSSSKNVKSKTAASKDFFESNASGSAAVRADFEGWLTAQVDEVFPAQNTVASEGIAGQIADGSSTRYVNAKGLEYNQALNKSLIGALMVDQILNNYISTSVLDAGSNKDNNNNDVVVDGKGYTNMEHKWDEAYGYLYGTSADKANPNATIGSDDSFLNKYLGKVDSDSDFSGIAQTIFEAFALGRAAIVAKDYTLRDAQTAILRENISQVVAVRAVYYLQQGKNLLAAETPDYGAAFHDLSEGYGFVYSLQFTRKPGTNSPYFSRPEVLAFLDQITTGNGFWDVSPATLEAISTEIASRFNFTVAEAKD
ncbi:MAG: DUF4856 domain-containing protein [Flavobacteriaceae bacterium]